MEYTLKIKDERYFNNGNLILPFLKDEGNHPLGEKIKEWLQSKYDLTELVRKNKHGVKAEALNKALRAKLEIEGAHKETHVLYNGFSHKGKEGFVYYTLPKQKQHKKGAVPGAWLLFCAISPFDHSE